MALLKKLKSLFGLDEESQPESSRDVGVTVEKERQAGTATESAGDDSSSTTEETAEESTDETASEPEPESEVESTEPESESTEQGSESAEQGSESAEQESESTGPESESTGPAATEDDTDETGADTTDEEPEENTDPVDDIKGIGPAYADRLGNIGIETIADLADADPESVAAETEISETRVAEWVKRAKARS